MKLIHLRLRHIAALLAAGLLLGSCSGSSDGEPEPEPPKPPAKEFAVNFRIAPGTQLDAFPIRVEIAKRVFVVQRADSVWQVRLPGGSLMPVATFSRYNHLFSAVFELPAEGEGNLQINLPAFQRVRLYAAAAPGQRTQPLFVLQGRDTLGRLDQFLAAAPSCAGAPAATVLELAPLLGVVSYQIRSADGTCNQNLSVNVANPGSCQVVPLTACN